METDTHTSVFMHVCACVYVFVCMWGGSGGVIVNIMLLVLLASRPDRGQQSREMIEKKRDLDKRRKTKLVHVAQVQVATLPR